VPQHLTSGVLPVVTCKPEWGPLQFPASASGKCVTWSVSVPKEASDQYPFEAVGHPSEKKFRWTVANDGRFKAMKCTTVQAAKGVTDGSRSVGSDLATGARYLRADVPNANNDGGAAGRREDRPAEGAARRARRWVTIPPFMPIPGHAPADTSFTQTGASISANAKPLSASTTSARTAAPDSTTTDPKYLSCNAYVFQAKGGYPIAGDDGHGHTWPITNAAWLAAAEKAAQWSEDICRRFSPRDCIAYGAYLNSCAGGDIVRQWYGDGTQADPDVPHWLCEQGYASPLYSKFYPIRGVCPVRGPLPDGAVKPQIEAVMVQYNDREPILWKVSPIGCEPGHECTFQFFFPCEPLIPGKEPKIIDGGWIWKTEPGRIRPSGGTQ